MPFVPFPRPGDFPRPSAPRTLDGGFTTPTGVAIQGNVFERFATLSVFPVAAETPVTVAIVDGRFPVGIGVGGFTGAQL